MSSKLSHSESDYVIGRGFQEAVRLHAQDWLWRMSLGFTVHPEITKAFDGSPANVADLGCSNCVWLLTLALQEQRDWSYTGIDVSGATFPRPADLPDHVKLMVLDAFGDIPAELHNQFDVVHVRTFSLVVRGGSPLPLLTNIKKLLKSGGYIQWDELDASTIKGVPPTPTISSTYTDDFCARMRSMSRKTGIDMAWVPDIAKHMKDAGLSVVADIHVLPQPALRRSWTDQLRIGFESLGRTVAAKDPSLMGSQDEVEEVLDKATVEMSKGVRIDIESYCCVGRKP